MTCDAVVISTMTIVVTGARRGWNVLDNRLVRSEQAVDECIAQATHRGHRKQSNISASAVTEIAPRHAAWTPVAGVHRRAHPGRVGRAGRMRIMGCRRELSS
jgi:hypothetical protein